MPKINPILDNLIIENEVISIENHLIYNFLNESESAKFYNELFSEEHQKVDSLLLLDEHKKKWKSQQNAYLIMDEVVSFLEKNLHSDSVVIELGGGIYQSRSGNAYRRFDNYYPLDISISSITRYCNTYGKIGFVGDACSLPFKYNSIDCIFTHTFLEHPLEPGKVCSEIARVMKVGGIVVHNDAWFCRWWQRYGIIGLKKFEDMNSKEKIILCIVKITEIKILRIPPIVFRRILSLMKSKYSVSSLRFKRLRPNYQLHLGCDEDAASSIDPVDVIAFYESHGFVLENKISLLSRIFFPSKYVVLRKVKS
jgi:SAM-dependent methyltransferase